MDLEKLKVVALYYFKEKIGKEPDTLIVAQADNESQTCLLTATLGSRHLDIWMHPASNLIDINEELHHPGTFAEAAALAGYDRNLENLE